MIRTIPFVNSGTYQFALSPYSLKMLRCRGNYGGPTVGLWLQCHTGTQTTPDDTAIIKPANGTVPIESFAINADSEFLFDRAFDGLKDLVGPTIFVLSTTEATLTAATGETLFDVWFDIEEYEHPPDPSWTRTYNATPSVNNIIWAEASSAPSSALKQLYEIVLTGSSGGLTGYLKVFANTTPAVGEMPYRQYTIPINQAYPMQRLRFGQPFGPGLIPYTQEIAGGAPVDHYGCMICLEVVPGGYLGFGVTDWKYQVKYK